MKVSRKRFFVTGTDTEVGKTFVTSAMLHKLSGEGLRTIGLKPVAAGADVREGEEPRNSDALSLMTHASVKLPYAQVNPVLLADPVAPHIAAQNEQRHLQVSRLAGFCQGALLQPHDYAFVEGAGGWLVPLNERETLADLAVALQAGILLVVGLRLGCINHALLTVESIRSRGLPLCGWVANGGLVPDMAEQAANILTLKQLIPAPCLGVVPLAESPDAETVQTALDLAPITQ